MNKQTIIEIMAALPIKNGRQLVFYYRFSLLLFWFSLMCFFGVLVLLLWPYKLLTFEQPVKVLTPVVRAGEPVTLEIHYCKYSHLSATVATKVVDDVVTTLPDITVNNPIGCHVIKTQVLIPGFLSPGPHHLERKIIYHPNPLREVMIPYKTEDFNVVK